VNIQGLKEYIRSNQLEDIKTAQLWGSEKAVELCLVCLYSDDRWATRLDLCRVAEMCS